MRSVAERACDSLRAWVSLRYRDSQPELFLVPWNACFSALLVLTCAAKHDCNRELAHAVLQPVKQAFGDGTEQRVF